MHIESREAVPGYGEWLDRLAATYESVTFCCLHRLRDRALAECVGLHVAAGLVQRPTIFQFSGLPYSGRIGSLAERFIVEAGAGVLAGAGDWRCFSNALSAVPRSYQETFVDVCVWGRDDAHVAAATGLDDLAARVQREKMLAYFEALARRAVSHGDRL